MIFYIYEVKGIKNGCTIEWDKRCKQNFKKYNITPVVVETYEYPNTAEYWQIVGDREWALAELNGYPKGVHYRIAMERRSAGGKIGGKITGKILGKKNVESGQIFLLSKARRKLTFEDAQIIRELYSTGKYNQPQLAQMYGVSRACISHIINNRNYINP